MKLLSRLFFATFLLITFSSCEKKHEHTTKGRYLNINMPGDPKTMDPRKGGDIHSSAMHFMLFEGLTRMSENSTSELGLAKKIDLSDDKLIYTFHLRDSHWSNGQPVTATDFAYSWKTMLDPSFPCPNANLLYPILNAEKAKSGLISQNEIGIKVINNKTLQVTLESPTPYFLNLVSFCVFYPVNHKIASKNLRWCDNVSPDFVSNGPYKISEWKHDDKIIVEKNEHYWDKENVHLSGAHISLVNNENTALEMFKNGDLDLLGGPFTNITIDSSSFLNKNSFLASHPDAKTQICSFNVERPPFNNKHIRKALGLAINRDAVVKSVGVLDEIPAVNFVTPTLKNGKNKAFIKTFDPLKAIEELEIGLKELDMDRSEFQKIVMVYPNYEINHKLAQILQQQWRETLGLQIKIESVNHVAFITKTTKKDFDMCQYYWIAQYHDQMNILDRFKKRQNPKNYSNWENQEYIKHLDASFYATGEERDRILEKAESIIMEEMPITTIFHACSYQVTQPYVKGFFASPLGSLHLQKVVFEEEALARK
ncbi:MAG: Oligopeptide-binding protein OppA [Chlamydiia bacterium]|nr:Oligopeptide-binding protein OppA [Chlamydiia bacterium]